MRRRCFCSAEYCCCSQFDSSGRAGPGSHQAPSACLANPANTSKPTGGLGIGMHTGAGPRPVPPASTQPHTRQPCPTEPRVCPSDGASHSRAIPLGQTAVWHLTEGKGSGGPWVAGAAVSSPPRTHPSAGCHGPCTLLVSLCWSQR